MKRMIALVPICLCAILLVQNIQVLAEEGLKAAFVRDRNLWVKENGEENKITQNGDVSRPKWSYDGTWIAYSQNSHIKLYNVKTNKSHLISRNGKAFKWAPDRNTLAFLDGTILNIYDAAAASGGTHFANVALGVDQYSWLPDGSGFLAVANADLHPNGWTNPILYKIPAKPGLNPDKVERFFTIPGHLKAGNTEILSIGTTIFKWSSDRQWIAFIVNPTASWSADSDILCVLSADGESFHTVDVVLAHPDWFKWAPSQNKIGYIAGIGRIWLKNQKELKTTWLPTLKSAGYTPEGFAPRSFTWENNKTIVVARIKQKGSEQEPLPSLYRINVKEKQQKKITAPPEHFGDFAPHFYQQTNQLAWIRSDRKKANVWIAKPDGSEAHAWIENIGSQVYAGEWSAIIDVYPIRH